jgi:hypothetical protein
MDKKITKGFTLLETVIYTAIISLVIAAFITFILVISGLRNKFYAIEEIRANERAMQEIFYHYLRNAREVIAPAKQQSASRLDFIPGDSSLNNSFFEKDGRLLLFDGTTSTALTSSKVVVSGLNVKNMSASGTPDVLAVRGTIKSYASSSIDNEYEENFKYNISLPR